MENSMKIRVFLGLCVVLGAGFISVCAADTPAQAAARAALEQMLNQPDNSPTRSLPATNTLSKAVVEQPAIPATTATGTVPEKAATLQITQLATTPVAAPAAVSPVAAAPAAVSPAPVAPAAISPTTPFLLLSLLFLSLLLVLLLIMALLMLKLRTLKLMLLKHPAILATGKLQPAAAPATPRPAPAPVAAKRPSSGESGLISRTARKAMATRRKLTGQPQRRNAGRTESKAKG